MPSTILITGGAGFIGSHLANTLLARGYKVRVLDNLNPEVHGNTGRRPGHLKEDVELMIGDICDQQEVRRAMKGIDIVFHFAARMGAGQNMYEQAQYTSVNNTGTAVLLQQLIHGGVKKLIVASSMSIYGEGLYKDIHGQTVKRAGRFAEQLQNKMWEPVDFSGIPLLACPTAEHKQAEITSAYALSKSGQERMCLLAGEAYQLPVIALRFFNVYGAHQMFSNLYTGALTLFAWRLLNDKRPLLFEDGLQQRDFVHIKDAVAACCNAMDLADNGCKVYNIGSGRSSTFLDVATTLARITGREHILPEISGKYREGDIRHCFADIGKAWTELRYRPQVSLEKGLAQMTGWLQDQCAADRFMKFGQN